MLFQEIYTAVVDFRGIIDFRGITFLQHGRYQSTHNSGVSETSFISFFLINLISNYESLSHLTDKTISSDLQASKPYKGFGK